MSNGLLDNFRSLRSGIDLKFRTVLKSISYGWLKTFLLPWTSASVLMEAWFLRAFEAARH
ncbi:hypothetical protein C3F00_030100 [Pseudomonas sp. MWU13-2860]|nr:hypothetical protein C3F00_030100 [Pseudomonas sp. MWU13-2860]